MSLLSRVSRFAARHSMWRPDTRVVAAVSGGSDSVGLLFLLHGLHTRGDVVLDAVAHLNHQIRPEADADERFCAELATRLKVPFIAAHIDVPARALAEKRSREVAAREARRAFLTQVADERGANAVATAHTQDDQAETLLLRIARGTGLRGLGGIAPVHGGRIRPLLELSRAELQQELRHRGEPWREDATNADLSNPRNRVRHELLPYLQQHFNPSVVRSLTRLADLARTDDVWMAEAAASAAKQVVTVAAGEVRLDCRALQALPGALARRVVQHALETVSGGAAAGFEDVETVRAVAFGAQPAAQVSGARVEHSAGSVVLIGKGHIAPQKDWFRVDLPIPGTVLVAGTGWQLEAVGPQTRLPGSVWSASNFQVEVDAANVGSHFVVRSRRPGDLFQPLGMSGRKKVQDVFVDRKVNRNDRDSVPIVTDVPGRIVWVAGHVLGAEFRVTEHTNAVIILKLRRI